MEKPYIKKNAILTIWFMVNGQWTHDTKRPATFNTLDMSNMLLLEFR